MRIVTVLKRGKPEFTPDKVVWLCKQVREHNPQAELICLSDMHFECRGIEVIPLRHPWGTWWSKLNLFDPAQLPGDFLFVDLDTVVLGALDSLVNLPRSTALQDFYKPHLLASGLMYIKESDKAAIFSEFSSAPSYWMNRPRTRLYLGDQGYLHRFENLFDRWQIVAPGQVVSYKVHVRKNRGKIPAGAKVVCFHGNPRPWAPNLNYDWLPKL